MSGSAEVYRDAQIKKSQKKWRVSPPNFKQTPDSCREWWFGKWHRGTPRWMARADGLLFRVSIYIQRRRFDRRTPQSDQSPVVWFCVAKVQLFFWNRQILRQFFGYNHKNVYFSSYFIRFLLSVISRSCAAHRSVARIIFSPHKKRKSGSPFGWITAFCNMIKGLWFISTLKHTMGCIECHQFSALGIWK